MQKLPAHHSKQVPPQIAAGVKSNCIDKLPIELPCVCAYSRDGMKARKLLHTRYRVSDLERSVKFYKEVLGLEEVRRHKSPRGSELVFLKAPESEETIEICYFPNSGKVEVQPDLTHLAFQVDSLAEFEKHLAKHGLKYSDGPHMKENGSGFAFIDAPEGYEIELMQLARTTNEY
jgi:lactoylglutathione lyase